MMALACLSMSKGWELSKYIVVAFPFSMPFLHESYISLFNWLNTFLRLGGSEWVPPNDGGNMLFLNTAGLALFLVGMMLIYASRDLSSRIEILVYLR